MVNCFLDTHSNFRACMVNCFNRVIIIKETSWIHIQNVRACMVICFNSLKTYKITYYLRPWIVRVIILKETFLVRLLQKAWIPKNHFHNLCLFYTGTVFYLLVCPVITQTSLLIWTVWSGPTAVTGNPYFFMPPTVGPVRLHGYVGRSGFSLAVYVIL